jgi:hypothetical protein
MKSSPGISNSFDLEQWYLGHARGASAIALAGPEVSKNTVRHELVFMESLSLAKETLISMDALCMD